MTESPTAPVHGPSSVATAPAAPRLRTLAIQGAFWSFAGHGTHQAIRLGGNLLLTRLLFPEAFGLMALVQVVTRGLEMFSEIGVNSSVVRDPRGDEPGFLNTAWTLRVIRGFGLWLMASLVAWPASWIYDQPLLIWMIPVAGLGSIVRGFDSIATLSCRRHVQVKPLVIRDIAGSILGLIAIAVLAVLLQSVWALVIGGVIRAVVICGLSYVMLPGPRAHFAWDRDAAREIYRFGRWIFVSTALTFLLQQGDRAILGAFITPEQLGIYAIAAMLSRALLEVLLRLNGQVLFPIYSRLANSKPDQLRRRILQTRALLLAGFLPVTWILVVWGSRIVHFLYDTRYADAGWMLQALAAGTAGAIIATTTGSVLLAVGDSARYMILQISRGTLMVAGMALGGWLAGMYGLVLGIAVSKFLDYPVLAWSIRRYGVWLPKLDAVAYLTSLAVAAAALLNV